MYLAHYENIHLNLSFDTDSIEIIDIVSKKLYCGINSSIMSGLKLDIVKSIIERRNNVDMVYLIRVHNMEIFKILLKKFRKQKINYTNIFRFHTNIYIYKLKLFRFGEMKQYLIY